MPPSPYGPYNQPPPPPLTPQTNGFATAGLILGILPTGVIGLIFSILGLVRAPKVGGLGRTRALIGLILSVLWMVGGVVAVTSNLSKRLDPACISAEGYGSTLESKMNADQGNIDALKQDLQDAVTELNTDAAKTSNATTKAAILKFSGDIKELLDDINNGTAPSADLTTRLTTDGNAVDTACGR